MSNATKPHPARRIIGFTAAAIFVIFGVAAIAQGLDGRSTVESALAQEKIVGTPTMTPNAIAAEADKRGVAGLTYPTCSVAGESIATGAQARCFAEYMRVDALMATGGKTYAEMPRFASEDGKGTNDEAAAVKMDNGAPLNNPARQVWVTETALATALNTSYMASQIALFGVAVGGAFLLVGFLFALFAGSGLKVPKHAKRTVREPALESAS